MANHFTAEQLEIFKDTFLQFDKDGDKSISTKELGTVLRALGMDVTELELKMMIAEVDADKSGSIEFDEFLTMVAYRIRDTDVEEETRMAFRLFDESGTGYISAKEIKHLMASLGESLTSEEEVMEMLSRADLNEAGKVNYEALITKMMYMDKKKKHRQVQFKEDDTVPSGTRPSDNLPGPSGGVIGVDYGVETKVNRYEYATVIQEGTGYH